MDLYAMQCFVEVCKTLNYSETADRLFISRQALRQKIRSLENELDEQLILSKGNRSLELTEFGQIYLKEAKRVLSVYSDMEKRLALYKDTKTEIIKIVIGMGKSTIFMHNFAELQNLYPKISLSFQELSDYDAISAIRNENMFDLGIVNAAPSDLEGLNSQFLHDFPTLVGVHLDNPLSRSAIIRIADLDGQPFVITDEKEIFAAQIQKKCREQGINIRFIVTHSGLQEYSLLIAKKNHGLTICGPNDIERFTSSHMRICQLEMDIPKFGTWMIAKDNPISIQVCRIMDYLIKNSDQMYSYARQYQK